jgi:hypothetical protein
MSQHGGLPKMRIDPVMKRIDDEISDDVDRAGDGQ